jgi:hypothetical protein
VDAIKRTCIGKLGRMLVVHLQRFGAAAEERT